MVSGRIQINFEPASDVPMSRTLDVILRPYFPESNWNEFVTACYEVSQRYKDAHVQAGRTDKRSWIVAGIGILVMIVGFVVLARQPLRASTEDTLKCFSIAGTGIGVFLAGMFGVSFCGYPKTQVQEELTAVCEEASAKLTSVSIQPRTKTDYITAGNYNSTGGSVMTAAVTDYWIEIAYTDIESA